MPLYGEARRGKRTPLKRLPFLLVQNSVHAGLCPLQTTKQKAFERNGSQQSASASDLVYVHKPACTFINLRLFVLWRVAAILSVPGKLLQIYICKTAFGSTWRHVAGTAQPLVRGFGVCPQRQVKRWASRCCHLRRAVSLAT